MGYDIEACEPTCSVKAGVFDLYATKVNALRLAVDAAITVLRYVRSLFVILVVSKWSLGGY